MNEKSLIYLSYFLVLVGYMTLTLSLPLINLIPRYSTISIITIQNCISVLFVCFSLSAIILGRIADMIGSYRVLKFAQLASIAGLIMVGFADSSWVFFLGFTLIGAGTGCYSAIARLLISKYSLNHLKMRKAFANFSILVVVAPILSAYISFLCSRFNWRFAYFLMAIIEFILLLFVIFILIKFRKYHKPFHLPAMMTGYLYSLKKPYFLFNMISVGIYLAVFIKIILGDTHQLISHGIKISQTSFSFIIAGMSVFYIIGIYLFRSLPEKISLEKLRVFSSMLLLLCTMIFYLVAFHFGKSTIFIITTIYIICIILGFLIPLATSTGLIVIKDYYGAAAALYTFSFALISSFYSIIQTYISIDAKKLTTIMIFVSAILLLIISLILSRIKKAIVSSD